MPRDLASVKRDLEEAVARLPGTPATPIEDYYRYEEMASAILDAVAYSEAFPTKEDVEVLRLYALKLCEVKALELNVVLDFEG